MDVSVSVSVPTTVSGPTADPPSLLVEVPSEIEEPFVFVTVVESSAGSSVTVYVKFDVAVTKMVTSIVVVVTRRLAVGQSSTARLIDWSSSEAARGLRLNTPPLGAASTAAERSAAAPMRVNRSMVGTEENEWQPSN